MRFRSICGANLREISANLSLNLCEIRANLNKIHGKIHTNRPANQTRI